MKFVEKRNEKVFTTKEKNNIMRKKYNPLYKPKNYYKGDEIFMGEKDIVKKGEINLEKLLDERIKNNQKLFSEEEWILFEKNKKLFTKIYLLGISDTIK